MPRAAPTESKGARTSGTIVDVAERLWGERGIDAVSLREISAAAGLSNPASVQYHFGGRDELILAIYQRRLPTIDARRRELIDALQAAGGTGNVRALLDCLFRPLFEQVDAQGRHSYASFLRQVLLFEPASELRGKSMDLSPSTGDLLKLFNAATPDMPANAAAHRMIAANMMMLDVLVKIDRLPSSLGANDAYEDTLSMLAAALSTPFAAAIGP